MGDLLLKEAEDAISACFSDRSVNVKQTRERMETLLESVENYIEALDIDGD